MNNKRSSQRARKRHVIVVRVLMAWIFLISVYFLWEANNYTGLYAFFAEKQFNYLGQYWPVLTFSLLMVLFGWPIAWLLKDTRSATSDGDLNADEDDEVWRLNQNLLRTLFSVAGGLTGAALVTLCWTLTLPRFSAPTAVVRIGSRQSFNPPLGSISLKGGILYDRTSVFAQNLIFKTRGIRFAPIINSQERVPTIRYFIELQPSDTQNRVIIAEPVLRAGLLRVNGLPGSIVQLYKYAGFKVSHTYYVLYTDPRTIRWPYYVAAAQLAIAALISLIVALFQNRYTNQQIKNSRKNKEISI